MTLIFILHPFAVTISASLSIPASLRLYLSDAGAGLLRQIKDAPLGASGARSSSSSSPSSSSEHSARHSIVATKDSASSVLAIMQ